MRFSSLVGLAFLLVLGCGTSSESDSDVTGGAAGDGAGGDAGTGGASTGGASGGEGGSSEGGSSGGGESSAGQSSGGSGSNENCREVECFRPYECVTECGSDDILNNGCCPCPEGRIDLLSCGAGGEGGSGSSGAAGQAGSGAESAGASGASSEDVTHGGASSGGAGGHDDCREVQCFRPYECVTECGSDDILNNGCCPCPEGRIDVLSCGEDGGD